MGDWYEEARARRRAGHSVREIAFALDRADSTVARHTARRLQRVKPKPTWEELAEQMASVYPDQERRQWIRQELKAWAQRR